MTRKRFVKLCMSQGYSRNAANQIAMKANSEGKKYDEAYETVLASMDLMDALIPSLSKAIEQATKVIKKMATAISEGVAAFSKAFSAAMTEE